MADTSGTAAGSAHEPSMEDILASIRRMIADDDVPAVNTADAPPPVAEKIDTDSAALEPTALVQAAKPAATVPPPSAPTPVAAPVAVDTDLVFENFETDFDLEDDLTIPDAKAIDDAVVPAAAAVSETLDSADADDTDLIDIDELIAEVEARSDADAAEVVDETAVSDTPAAVSENSDIELVKSLMADLTEDDLAQETSDAELDEILSEIAEIERDETLDLDIDTSDVDEDFNALLKIAQEAKADAGTAKFGTGLAVAATGVTAAAVAAKTPTIAPTQEIQDNNTTEKYNEETTTMADAVEETIIQGEVEEATVSAFASLASVVERKDEVSSAGPGIGDLVKEALQPMLKEWLDKNLKGIVERSVAKEIKRIANTK